MKKIMFILVAMFTCVWQVNAQLKVLGKQKGYVTLATSDAKLKSLSLNQDSGMYYLIDDKPYNGYSGFSIYIPLGKSKEEALISLEQLLSLFTTTDDIVIDGRIAHKNWDGLEKTILTITPAKLFGFPCLDIRHPYNDSAYGWDKNDVNKMIKALK